MSATTERAERYRHEAYFYAGEDEFTRSCAAFIKDGLAAGEPVLVVVQRRKIDQLRRALGRDADAVTFADMGELGRNPAQIIAHWDRFVAEKSRPDGWVRGIGEPIDTHRGEEELSECHLHESLLNVAFDEAVPLWLRCPYDVSSLPPAVIEFARRNHPVHVDADGSVDIAFDTAPIELGPLLAAPADAAVLAFGPDMLQDARAVVLEAAARAALDGERAQEFALAVNELAVNSIRHGGGGGTLRCWVTPGALVAEVSDAGRIADPLAGRVAPTADRDAGRGLWLATQLTDLLQIRSSADGTTVRARIHR